MGEMIMKLGFSIKWPKRMGELAGLPNYFIEKILNSLPDTNNYFPFICTNCKNKGMSMLLDTELVMNDEEYFCNKCGYSSWIEDFDIELKENYIGSFAPKCHTIREDKTNRWKAGNDIHFVINNRTKDRFQFAPVVKCRRVQKIHIKIYKSIEYDIYGEYSGIKTNREVWVDDFLLSKDATKELAINDGFPDTKAFFDFFENGFIGKIIHWTDKRY